MERDFSCHSSGEFPGATELLKRLSCFSVGNFSDGNSCSIYKLHQFQAIRGHTFNFGAQNRARMEPGRAAWERMEVVSNGTCF